MSDAAAMGGAMNTDDTTAVRPPSIVRPVQPRREPEAPPRVGRHAPALPLQVGTRGSPLALWQTRHFLASMAEFCPALREMQGFEEQVIATSGDQVLDRRLAEIGGKGLFAKEIHEALLDRRVDFAVHSLKDLETELPPGIVLVCVMRREDARDALVLADNGTGCHQPWDCLPQGARVATASVRRQSQLLHARPDLQVEMIRGNVQSRLRKLRAEGGPFATMLALAGLRRMELEHEASLVIPPEAMLPAACQGIVGITARAADTHLQELLKAIEDRETRAMATAERALLGALDGSCRTPIGGHAVPLPGQRLRLTGLVARADGSFLARRSLEGDMADAVRLGTELADELRALAPADIFC